MDWLLFVSAVTMTVAAVQAVSSWSLSDHTMLCASSEYFIMPPGQTNNTLVASSNSLLETTSKRVPRLPTERLMQQKYLDGFLTMIAFVLFSMRLRRKRMMGLFSHTWWQTSLGGQHILWHLVVSTILRCPSTRP